MNKVHTAEELAPALNFAAEYGMKFWWKSRHRGKSKFPFLQSRSAGIRTGRIVPHREFYDYTRSIWRMARAADSADLKPAQVRKVQAWRWRRSAR